VLASLLLVPGIQHRAPGSSCARASTPIRENRASWGPRPAAEGRIFFLAYPAFSLRSVWDKSQTYQAVILHKRAWGRAGLTVESQEVVPVEARTADRWSMVEATMRAVPVVVVKPGKKMFLAVL
jgi:hypothetical protein